MKKAVSIILVTILLLLTAAASANAQIVNPERQSVDEAIAAYEAETGATVSTNRIYFKMPVLDNWYCDQSVYQGKYYAGIYWWGSETFSPDLYPGYRASIDDYEQGVYYADVPDDVANVIWNNGYYSQKTQSGPRDPMITLSVDLNIEGAWEGDYETLPEGSPNEDNMDGCIFVYSPDAVTLSQYYPYPPYPFEPYIYYGGGCYGSYAVTSEHFVSIAENCLNPDHFDEQGNHIGGAHITAPDAPESPPVDSSVNGYYFVTDSEPNTIRSENKLCASNADGEYCGYRYISQQTRFKIVYYTDGAAVSDCEQYPVQGWYNENGEFNNYPTGKDYTVYFRPDGSGDSSYIDGTIKAAPYEELPTEWAWENPSEPPDPLPDEPPQQTNQYKDRFDAYFNERCGSAELLSYKELYCHRDHNDGTDWVLVYATSNLTSPSFLNIIVGNRVMMLSCYGTPFDTGYGVYDVKNDTFVDAASAQAKNYPDFVTVFDEVGTGRLIGDLDGDDTLSVVDATVMQRCLVWMRDFPSDDEIIPADGAWGYSCRYYSDFDRDGEREITDATKLQRYLIGIV